MKIKIDTDQFRALPDQPKKISDWATKIEPLYQDKKEYKKLLEEYQDEIFDLQNKLYAHDRYSLLLVFQGMDTAGKDGAIRHVMSGIDPAGVQVFSFKKPSSREMDHDYLWRTSQRMPERGRVGIFNRSYYEEVLIVRVHPAILFGSRIPKEHLADTEEFWQTRYTDIKNHEAFLNRNGTRIVKFFLHISKEEQRQRFLARIDRPDKNWKFSMSDVKERGFWDKYQEAYEACINNTTSNEAPWYVIPSDDKKNARIIIAKIVLEAIQKLHISYPEVTEEHRQELLTIRKQLEAE